MVEFFRTLAEYRGILFYRTLASLRAESRALYLGYAWWLLEPVLNTAVYFVIFGLLLGTKTPNFIGYLLLGTIVFQWFNQCVMGSMGTITARAHLFRQIPMPKYLFAIIGMLTNTWKFVIVFCVIFGYIAMTSGVTLGLHLLWIPIMMVIQLVLMCGMAIIVSIGAVYYQDLQKVMSVVFRALMFLSAIFWDVRKVPEDLRTLFFSNPAATFINAYRDVVLHDRPPEIWHLVYVAVFGVFLLQVGIYWHSKVDGHILKHVQT